MGGPMRLAGALHAEMASHARIYGMYLLAHKQEQQPVDAGRAADASCYKAACCRIFSVPCTSCLARAIVSSLFSSPGLPLVAPACRCYVAAGPLVHCPCSTRWLVKRAGWHCRTPSVMSRATSRGCSSRVLLLRPRPPGYSRATAGLDCRLKRAFASSSKRSL